jgi:hypothetical protein
VINDGVTEGLLNKSLFTVVGGRVAICGVENSGSCPI